jgi:catechol 2,3-dioxygenase
VSEVPAFQLPDDTELSGLELRVRDLDASVEFYRGVLGLDVVSEDDGTVLAPAQRRFTLTLRHAPDAVLRPYPCPGLYHFALLVPDRPALGTIFEHLLSIRYPFEGMSDHLVSEALYIRDPEFNGIELYRDRPKSEWTRINGGIAMASDPIDAEGILASAPGPGFLDAGTVLGHMHLHGRDLDEGESFYVDLLGLHQTAEMPSARFWAAGDYHHHMGFNTWAPVRDVPDNATGLLAYGWRVSSDALGSVAERTVGRRDGDRFTVTDPLGVEVTFAKR